MNKNILKSFISIFTLTLVNNLFSADSIARSMSNDNAEVYIVSPSDNQVIENPITIKFGITDMEILPAGIKKEYSGHHHLLVDVEDLPDFSKPIPADKNHIHFGNGQTEVTKDLMKKLASENVKIIYNVPKINILDIEDKPLVEFDYNKTKESVRADFIVGCDGFHGISKDYIPNNIKKIYK